MFLNKLFGPQIVFGSGGGGGGGGGSSSSRSSAPKTSPRPKPRPAPKPAPKPKPKPAPKPKSSGGGKGSSKPKSTSKGRDLNADMYAGSTYKKQPNGSYKSPTSVTAKDLKSGNVSTYKSKTGTGSITVARGTKLADVPTVNVGVNGGKTRSNADVYDSKDVAAPKTTAPVSTGSSAPVTAPERIDPTDGVGGGRDGGGSARRKASKTSEDNVQVKRAAEGVDKYKKKRTVAAKANPMAIAAKRKA